MMLHPARWIAGPLLLLFVTALLGAPGCDRTETIDTSLATAPALPEEYQGLWRFDRARTLATWQETLPEDLYKQQMQFVAMLDQLGHPVHSDVRVEDASVIGENGGGGVEPQYDFTEWSQHEGLIRGNAWWHEDRHDPGARSTQSLTLQMKDGTFWLGFGDGGPRTLWFLFGRGE